MLSAHANRHTNCHLLFIIHQSHYIIGIQPLHFKGGFLTLGWELILFLEAMPDSFLQLIPPTGRGKIWTAPQYFRGKRLNWFFSANSIPWKLGPRVCMSSSWLMYFYVMRACEWVWGVVSGCEINMLASGFVCVFPPSTHTLGMNAIACFFTRAIILITTALPAISP